MYIIKTISALKANEIEKTLSILDIPIKDDANPDVKRDAIRKELCDAVEISYEDSSENLENECYSLIAQFPNIKDDKWANFPEEQKLKYFQRVLFNLLTSSLKDISLPDIEKINYKYFKDHELGSEYKLEKYKDIYFDFITETLPGVNWSFQSKSTDSGITKGTLIATAFLSPFAILSLDGIARFFKRQNKQESTKKDQTRFILIMSILVFYYFSENNQELLHKQYSEIKDSINSLVLGTEQSEGKISFSKNEEKIFNFLAADKFKDEHTEIFEDGGKVGDDKIPIIAHSKEMLKVFEDIKIYKNNDLILLTGETGVGKTHIAELFSQITTKFSGDLTVYDAGSDKDQIEKDLKGIAKGAYTGVDEHESIFIKAGNGTLFIDEFGEIEKKCSQFF